MRAFHDDKSIGNVPDSIDKLHVCTSKRLNITIISAIVAVASEDERERARELNTHAVPLFRAAQCL